MLLIASRDTADAQALTDQLRALGWHDAAAIGCDMMVREATRLAPDAVIVSADGVDAALLDDIALLRDLAPHPVLLLAPELVLADVPQLLDAGVHEWRAASGNADEWARWLALARARCASGVALQRALAEARERLDERKWIDRAKGVLMQSQQINEEDAFALLRSASMHANLRVGEVSRGVIEAARAADSINRAGQLRMLSQRIVKALALRESGFGRAAADEWLADSRQRAAANIESLRIFDVSGEASTGLALLLAAVRQACRALDQRLDASPVAPLTLAEADTLAEALLDAADALTAALERAAGRRALRVVNLCGRQRMLSQRLAKQALLASMRISAESESEAQAAALALTRAEFESALRELEALPLTSDAIRAALANAGGQWQRLLEGLRRPGPGALARESEALLASFEELTSLYEHSIQVLLA